MIIKALFGLVNEMLSAEDKVKLKRLCQEIIDKPRMMEDQPHQRKGKYLWCEDWEMIEILKYLFLGKDEYHRDPPPNRLKGNPLWSKSDIEGKVLHLMEMNPKVESIIEIIRTVRDGSTSRV